MSRVSETYWCGHEDTRGEGIEEATDAIRKVHDFLTVGAAAPLQEGAAAALAFPESYYGELARSYHAKRDTLLRSVRVAGFALPDPPPVGAYYLLTDASALIEAGGFPDGDALARWMVAEAGIGTVPGSSFYRPREDGTNPGAPLIRFCYCKRPETLALAERLLSELPARLARRCQGA